ncbi:MAG: S1C family serine protease [Candidatus Uhrbacteria bacterium]
MNKYLLLSLVLACVIGALSGAAASLLSDAVQITPQLQRLSDQIAHVGTSSTIVVVTSTKPITQPDVVVPVEGRPLLPVYPSAFVDRRNSSVLQLVKRGKNDGEPVASDRVIGSAVAVTSDGWIATADTALAGLRLADMQVLVGGRVKSIERGIRDLSTGIVYIKITASDLPTPAFVRASDVVSGSAVWRETSPRALTPELIVALRTPFQNDPVSSEKSGRRFIVTVSGSAKPGSALWDGGGRLVGLLESADVSGGWRVIPAGPIGSSLAQYLQTGSIKRASLGVRAFDLSGLSLDIATSTLPDLGAWIHADKKTGAVAVNVKGPSTKLLLDGDVIERIERDILDGTADLGERLFDYRPGVIVSISGRRKGEAFQTQITLGTESVSEPIK